jgi:putative Holliday junction resolvase
MLARPLATLAVSSAGHAIEQVLEVVARLQQEEDGLSTIVVGVPRRLDGSTTDATIRATAFVDALRQRTSVSIVTEGEQLTSREAESRLAMNERDWRKRKQTLDAAAAAIILQDYLDRQR